VSRFQRGDRCVGDQARCCTPFGRRHGQDGGAGFPYLPHDRRHYVAWSTVEPSDFTPDQWAQYWATLNAGGADAVADHLRALDLTRFNPKAPPPHTQAFWEMVNAMRSEKESEMDDIIESLERPDALIIGNIISRASTLARHGFVEWLKDGKNARQTALFLEDCGYRRQSSGVSGINRPSPNKRLDKRKTTGRRSSARPNWTAENGKTFARAARAPGDFDKCVSVKMEATTVDPDACTRYSTAHEMYPEISVRDCLRAGWLWK
jgi:hypothetical protein